jgi:hypothetical protein
MLNFYLTLASPQLELSKIHILAWESRRPDIEALDSLGLQLVTSLVAQIDGGLEIKRDNGTEFTIKFTVAGNNNQISEPFPQQPV